MNGDFYEDDEPVEKIRDAFERGEKDVTRRPRDPNQLGGAIVNEATNADTDWGVVAAPATNLGVTIREMRFTTGYITVGHTASVKVS